MRMRGRRRAAHHVCQCCNDLIIYTRAAEKRESERQVMDEVDWLQPNQMNRTTFCKVA